MSNDRNNAEMRELTDAENEEVAGGATATYTIASPRTYTINTSSYVYRPYQYISTRPVASTSLISVRSTDLVRVGSVCW